MDLIVPPDFSTTQVSDGVVMLRTIRPADAFFLHQAVIASYDELYPWMPWCHDKYGMADAEKWCNCQENMWDGGVEYGFAITDMESGAYLGGCGINRVDSLFRTANLGYWVRTDWAGRGVATRAAILLAKWGFGAFGFNRIEIIMATGNLASIRVAEKIGAAREGVLRNRLEFHGKLHQAVMFSLIPGDIS